MTDITAEDAIVRYNPQGPPASDDAAENLRDVIWRRALVRRFGATALTPKEADVAALQKILGSQLQDNYNADLQIVALIHRLLEKNVYLPVHQEHLRRILQGAERSVHLYAARQQAEASRPAAYQFITQAAETKLARQNLTRWQADKLLYSAYGGKVVQADAAFEPVAAYGRFLDYITKDGALRISAPALQGAMQPVADAAKGSAAADNPALDALYFGDPLWRYTYIGGGRRLELMRQMLLNIPTVGLHSAPPDATGKTP